MATKYFFLMSVFFITISNVFTQNVSINNTGAAANTNAMLDIDDTTNTKGILIPRITEAQRTAMALTTTDQGLMVFQENVDTGYWFWNGIIWEKMGTSDNAFGQMDYHTSMADTVIISAVGTFYKIPQLSAGVLQHVFYSSGSLIIEKKGYYLMTYALSGYSTNTQENFETAFVVNGVPNLSSEIEQRFADESQKESSTAGQCLMLLNKGDVVTIAVKSDVTSSDFVATHGSVTVVSIN